MTEPLQHAPLIDTHFHLDLHQAPDRVLEQIEKAGVYTLAVTNAPSVFAATESLVAGARFVRPALGIHPELAVQRKAELPMLQELLPRTRYVGEVGLDYASGDRTGHAVQRRVFEEVVGWCDASGDKVLTIHSRRAEEDVIEVVGPLFRGIPILHWYSGPLHLVDRAVEAGFYFSINPAMARSRRFEALMNQIPRDRVLTETDGPFVKVGKEPALPQNVRLVVSSLCKVWGQSEIEVRNQLYSNFRQATTPANTLHN